MDGSVLVTGARGFVGKHLQVELGARAVPGDFDVTDFEAVATAVRTVQPDAVVHLAALSSVADSWGNAGPVWAANVIGTVNVLEAIRQERPDARAVVVSSGEVYGRSDAIPTPETEAPAPLSPYAASKAAAEVACARAARADGLDVVVARPFTHIGPGQDERFAVASWVSQVATLEQQGGGALRTGDLGVERDLTDVRDVCRAYRLLLDRSTPPGTYNVASGKAVALETVARLLVDMSTAPLTVTQDPARLRAVDIPVLVGDATLLRSATGWEPQIPLEETVSDMLAEARGTVPQEPRA